MTAGPGDNAAAGRRNGHLRASHADRERTIGTLKEAFVQGRLTADELDARVDQAYASRTYADLAEVTVDIPLALTQARPPRDPRDPWRATKVAGGVVYALILPGLITLAALPGGPGPLTVREVVTYSAITYAVVWILGLSVTVASRLGKRSAGKLPAQPAWMPEPGSDAAAYSEDGHLLPIYRVQVTSTFKDALGQGRLTADEYCERTAQAAMARSRAELAALVADLPAGRMDAPARPPTNKDVWVGVGVTLAAASVIAVVLLSNPDNGLAFMAFIIAAVTVLVAPILTVGVKVDARRHKRSGGPLPSA